MLVGLAGCSNSTDPIQPADAPAQLNTLEVTDSGNHFLWGYYNLDFNLENLTARAVPGRVSMTHFNITSLVQPPACNDCLVLEILDHNPQSCYIELKVTLKNNTTVKGYDVRGIVLPKVNGIQLLDAESYTPLWSTGAFSSLNPFRTFAHSVPSRIFYPQYWDFRIYEISYGVQGNLGKIGYAIDVSYPGNCEEPYEILVPQEPAKFIENYPTVVTVQILDWQEDVEWAIIYPYPLAMSDYSDYMQMTEGAENYWSASFTNSNDVSPGYYYLWVQAKSAGTDVVTWNKVKVSAQDAPPLNTIQVTYYAAVDTGGNLPYLENPGGSEIEFSYTVASQLRSWANLLWNKYGFNLVDDGTIHIMDENASDWNYYHLDSETEVASMHSNYGQSGTPDTLNMYFVQTLPYDLETAFCTLPASGGLSNHKRQHVYHVYSPNVYFWEEVMAHESGHAFGALEDIYLLLPFLGYYCYELKNDQPPNKQYLYCEDNAYYPGNLMWFSMGWSIYAYDLTQGQADWVEWFNDEYPENW
jgi:hypothetical protein